jgi:hypothetical protein
MKQTELKRTNSLRRTAFVSTPKPAKPRGRALDGKPKGKPLKTRQRAVTPAEKVIWSKLAALGCIACMKDGIYNPHVSIHHVDGRTKPGCHLLVLPLCGPHHQDDGSGAVAVHPWKARFERLYGDQYALVEECMQLIGKANESSKD